MQTANLVKRCRICGDQASGFNYNGYLSCESCKVFFHRNSLKVVEELKCRKGNGKCEITIQNRRCCTRCRLVCCLENGMRRKKRKCVEKEDNNDEKDAQDEDEDLSVSIPSSRRHSLLSSSAASSSPPVSEIETNSSDEQSAISKDISMYKTADQFIELQLTNKLSTVNIGDHQQNMSPEISQKFLCPSSLFQSCHLKLNSFEQKEIDSLAAAYDAAFGDEQTAKIIHKPKTVQEMMYNPDVYIRRTITFCQHFAGFNAFSEREQMLILKPYIFEATTLKFSFSFNPKQKSITFFSDNSGKEVYEVDVDFGKELITDDTAPKENMRCGLAIGKSLGGDKNLRNLLSAQMLFQPREGIVGEGCGGLLGNSEFMRYHFTYYSKLLQRYLESKYRCEEQAERKYAVLQGHRTVTMETIKNNKKRILDQFEGKLEVPEIIQELYDMI